MKKGILLAVLLLTAVLWGCAPSDPQTRLMEEAEARGITISEEDVDAFLESTVFASLEFPEGAEIIDSYCEENGLTFDEYVEQVREDAPIVIIQAKLEEAIAQEYCQAQGIPFDPLNPSPDVVKEVTVQMEEILGTGKEWPA